MFPCARDQVRVHDPLDSQNAMLLLWPFVPFLVLPFSLEGIFKKFNKFDKFKKLLGKKNSHTDLIIFTSI